MKVDLKKLFIVSLLFFTFPVFAQEEEENELSFSENILSERGHRFIEIRGAIPVHPTLTCHGLAQSTSVAFGEFCTTLFNADHGRLKPKLATDLNIVIYPPMANYHFGFVFGAALDRWEQTLTKYGNTKKETTIMDYYYGGLHIDYCHFVFSGIGTRISVYGELTVGWIISWNDDENEKAFFADVCPFGIQFCPEKHIGIYFEIPHIGARPVIQTGVSIGL